MLSSACRVLRPGGLAAFSLPSASSFRPSPQFQRLLPVPGIRLPESAADAARLLQGTGRAVHRAVDLPLGDAGRRAVLILAGHDTR
ncbi:MAG: hypothetical protein ABJB47_24525 [Actinomycetota bacterium]